MKRLRSRLAAACCVAALCPASGNAQSTKEQAPTLAPPKTKLEAFTGETGAVVIKGYTEIGTIRSMGVVTVNAMTFRNAKFGAETKGLTIEVTEATTYGRPNRAFIDYDEIADLLAGIDYIAKADVSAQKLANFEATYSTKGNLKITVFNNSSGINQVNVSIGSFGNGIYLKMPELDRFRQNIEAARNVLDNPDSVAVKRDRANPPPPQVVQAPSAATSSAPVSGVAAPLPPVTSPRPKTKPAMAPAIAPAATPSSQTLR